ncbi:rho GDP dissociation inhibitor [Coemansia sp. RSA 1722]|nr:rho GDP dissociation inhibitor [Coemansia sp. RSA 486]KAJ2237034.1 rho GDP dissociation inhibitor [Coemansia sp. RSA 485]KAJ2603523.1 rho GDP dissociation inhibitor [Coemansia sp. RSA 1721]KAJ2605299.1 rho GDP dissociation inhibitor [Coemansia sp. RSA 1722]KAJ2638673.1 rho GDP dissociation inhibitor [Coemansia sp. RSA 1286]KAJ2707208.1 rho GDP dissociation inhibitor [Coemansia sp. IMI 203386]
MSQQDDLVPTMTDGYKPGEKKELSELQQLDANDESLNKWKASLGLSADKLPFPNDPRSVIVSSLVLDAGERKVTMDVSTPEKIAELKNKTIVIKEGVDYSFVVEFYVQRQVISGLKFLQVVKRLGITMDRTENMCGSYGPKLEKQSKVFPTSTAPTGRVARGTYTVRSKFVDDDNNCHLEWVWNMKIKEEWE